MLRALSLDDLLNIRIERNPQRPTIFTVKASFLVSGTNDTITFDELTVEAELDDATPPRLIRHLGRATVSRTGLIRD